MREWYKSLIWLILGFTTIIIDFKLSLGWVIGVWSYKLLIENQQVRINEVILMKIKDLIGHTIVDISDNVEFMIKTNKGIYELYYGEYPDGTLSEITIFKSTIDEWEKWNK